MDSYSLGISGLSAAQKALEIIGNNIANAATDGYHRQRIELAPAETSQIGSILLGGGVDVVRITRIINNFLEEEILRQQSSLGEVAEEFATLRTIEISFGELSAGNSLSATIDEFFNSLQELKAHPGEIIWQRQTVTAAESMTSQFRTLGESLNSLETQIILEAGNAVDQINTLTNHIAELNEKIENIEIGGAQANNLRDQRDQCLSELSELVAIETQTHEFGVVNIIIAGIPVVTSASATELDVSLEEGGCLGIGIVEASNYNTNLQGGRLGGLFSLKNELISEIHNDFNDLASAIIQQVNQYHVQGVGSYGSFTELTGWPMPSEDLVDFDPPLTDGNIYIRIINTNTGEITREEIDIDVSGDSLTTIAADISAIDGLTAVVASSTLHIQADADYKFDFLPAVLSEPKAGTLNLTGTEPPVITVSGIYTGTTNSIFECTAVGGIDDEMGVTDGLKLEVRKDGQLIKELNVGLGYAAGDRLILGDGLYVSLNIDAGNTKGNLSNLDSFEIEAWADTDTSGVLAAAGLNTFFYGNNAMNMAVCSDITSSPGRVATALGAEMTDNTNVSRLAGLKDQAISSLNDMTPGEFYRQLVTNIGQQVFIKQMRKGNFETLINNLINQKSDISGVDINDEAAQMLIFEQMFQAIAKYLNTIQSSLLQIMEII
jgi:flagellar hook-associated protein 1 FlgK